MIFAQKGILEVYVNLVIYIIKLEMVSFQFQHNISAKVARSRITFLNIIIIFNKALVRTLILH